MHPDELRPSCPTSTSPGSAATSPRRPSRSIRPIRTTSSSSRTASAAWAWSWRAAPTGERPGTCRRSRATTGSARRAATPRCRGTPTATSSWRGSTSRTRAPSRSRSAPTGARRSGMLKVLRPNPPSRASRATRRRAPGRGRRGRGGEAGRRREGAGAEPEGLVRRPADDRGGRGIGLAHVEQQRHHAGVGGARVRAWDRSGSSPSGRTSRRAGTAASATSRSGPRARSSRCARRTRTERSPTVATIRAATDPDGLGPKAFTPAKGIATTNVQQFDAILPQRSRTVDAETGLAWDTDRDQPALRAPLPDVDRRAAEREQRHGHLAPLLGRRGRHVDAHPSGSTT